VAEVSCRLRAQGERYSTVDDRESTNCPRSGGGLLGESRRGRRDDRTDDKVRVMVPGTALEEVYLALQDVGLLNLAEPSAADLAPVVLQRSGGPEWRHLRRILTTWRGP